MVERTGAVAGIVLVVVVAGVVGVRVLLGSSFHQLISYLKQAE